MQVKRIVKYFLYFVIFIACWYFVTLMRTTEFGMTISSIVGLLYATALSLFPLSLVAFLLLMLLDRHNLRLMTFVRHIIIIAFMVIILSELWASSEEYLFKKKCTENNDDVAQEVWQRRWWPFTNNSLGYQEGVFCAQE